MLRRLRESDAMDVNLATKASYQELKDWVDWAKPDKPFEETWQYIAEQMLLWRSGQSYAFGAFSPDTGEFILAIDIVRKSTRTSFEIGYWCHSQFTGKGFMQEAVQAVTDIAFDELGAEHIRVRCAEDNIASDTVIQKCGFKYVGLFEKCSANSSGELEDRKVYQHTKTSWEKFKAEQNNAT